MTHVLILAQMSDPLVKAVRSTIADWSAVGLVRPTIWIDLARSPGAGVQANVLADGISRPIQVERWLPSQSDQDVQLVVLQLLDGQRSATDFSTVQSVLTSLNLMGHLKLINVLAPSSAATEVPSTAVFDGRANILLQPTSAASPQAHLEVLDADNPAFVPHVAAGLAAAAGVWEQLQGAPLMGEQSWTGARVSAARTYVRQLDTSEVLTNVAAEVFGKDGRLPVTRNANGEALPELTPEAQLAAAAGVAAGVLKHHGAITQFKRPAPFTPPGAVQVSIWDGCKMFGRFLLGAPGAWLSAKIQTTKANIANRSQRFFFGDDSTFAVTFGGLTATKNTDGGLVQNLERESRRVFQRFSQGMELPPATPAPSLWQYTVSAAAALADGNHGPDGITMPTQGATRLLVTDPARIAPHPSTAPFFVPAGVLDIGPVGPISPTDPYFALKVADQMDQEIANFQSTQGMNTQRLNQLHQSRLDLRGWIEGQRSMTWELETGLAVQLDAARQCQAELLRPTTQEDPAELDLLLSEQRKSKFRALAWLAAVLLAIAATVVLVLLALVAWPIVVGVGTVLIICFLWAAVATFVKSRRKLFHYLHKKQTELARLEWAETQMQAVSFEVIRLSSLYQQSEIWSQVVAENVHDPFGGASGQARSDDVPNHLSGPLPVSMTLARAPFDPVGHRAAINHARLQILQKGWLTRQIEIRRRHIMQNAARLHGQDKESLILSDAEYRRDGALDLYRRGLSDPAHKVQARDQAMRGLVSVLTEAGSEERLLPVVSIDAGASYTDTSWQQLTKGLLDPPAMLPPHGFSPTGVVERSHQVERSFVSSSGEVPRYPGISLLSPRQMSAEHMMDRTLLRWDLTLPAPTEHFAYFAGSPSERESTHDDFAQHEMPDA